MNRRPRDIIDQHVSNVERVRRMEVMPHPRTLTPGPSWSPDGEVLDAITSHVARLGNWNTYNAVETGLLDASGRGEKTGLALHELLQVCGFGNNVGDRKWLGWDKPLGPPLTEADLTSDRAWAIYATALAAEFTRFLQVVGAMPPQQAFLRLHDGHDFSVGNLPGAYGGFSEDQPHMKRYTFGPPYVAGTWTWLEPGDYPGVAGAPPIVGSYSLPTVAGVSWDEAVAPGQYVLKAADGSMAFLDKWGDAAWTQTDGLGHIIAVHPCEVTNWGLWSGPGPPLGELVYFPGDGSCSTPSVGPNPSGVNTFGKFLLMQSRLGPSDFFLNNPPRDGGSGSGEVINSLSGYGSGGGYPGFEELRARILQAFSDPAIYLIEPLQRVQRWYEDRIPYVDAAQGDGGAKARRHHRWQTMQLYSPWQGRVQFRIQQRVLYLRGNARLNIPGDRALVLGALPSYVHAAQGDRLMVRAAHEDGSPVPIRVERISEADTRLQLWLVPGTFNDYAKREVHFRNASFPVEKHLPEVR